MNLFILYIITLISSFCSLSYQILISHFLTEQTDSYIISQSLTFGIYAFSCGLGALFINRKKIQNIFKFFLKIESILVLLSLVTPFILMFSSSFFNIFLFQKILEAFNIELYDLDKLIMTLLVQVIIFIIGFFSGIEIASIFKIKDKLYDSTVRFIGLIFCAGCIGSLISSLVIPYFIIVSLGGLIGFLVIGSLNLIACFLFFALFSFKDWIPKRIAYYNLTFLIFLSFLFSLSPSKILESEQYNLKLAYSEISMGKLNTQSFRNAQKLINKLGDVQRFRSLYQTIDILDSNFNKKFLYFFNKHQYKMYLQDKKPNFFLFLNRNLQFASSSHQIYHESMAHAPINMLGYKPKNILILGGGDGLLLKEILRYKQNMEVTLVDIDKKMIHLAKNHVLISSLNKQSLSSPKVKIIIQDAFQFIKYSKNKYDAIYVDIPFPSNYNFIRLYTKEFFSHIEKHLHPKGFMIVDTPSLVNKDSKLPSVLVNTLIAGGFKKENLTGFGLNVHFIIGTKTNQKMEFDYEQSNIFKTKTLFNLIKVPGFEKIKINKKDVNSLYKPKLFMAFE